MLLVKIATSLGIAGVAVIKKLVLVLMDIKFLWEI